MIRYVLASLVLFLSAAVASAGGPAVNEPLPGLSIDDRGELVMRDGRFDYAPWRYPESAGTVRILQYIPGTQSGSEAFKPLTDILLSRFPQGGFHVTTVIDMEAAMWGTGGMVTSKAKSKKKEHPDSTLVLDEAGAGREAWQLGDSGSLLAIMDKNGKVIFLARKPLSRTTLEDALTVIGEALDG